MLILIAKDSEHRVFDRFKTVAVFGEVHRGRSVVVASLKFLKVALGLLAVVEDENHGRGFVSLVPDVREPRSRAVQKSGLVEIRRGESHIFLLFSVEKTRDDEVNTPLACYITAAGFPVIARLPIACSGSFGAAFFIFDFLFYTNLVIIQVS